MTPGVTAAGAAGNETRPGLCQVLLLSTDHGLAAKVAAVLQEGGHVTRAKGADDLQALLAAMQFDVVVVDEQHPGAAEALSRAVDNGAPVFVKLSAETSGDGTAVADLRSVFANLAVMHRREKRHEPVDVASFLARIDSDRTFFNTLAADLVVDLKTKLPELEEAVRSRDAKKVEFLAHGLKSVLALFGAEQASSTAAEIEHAAHFRSCGGTSELLTRFRTEIDSIQDQLRRLLPKNETP